MTTEDKFTNAIHSIHVLTDIDEEICRKAALQCISDYGLANELYFAEQLCLFLVDQQERRFIVTEFRKRVKVLREEMEKAV